MDLEQHGIYTKTINALLFILNNLVHDNDDIREQIIKHIKVLEKLKKEAL